jgi:hypothetical protein
MNRHGIVPNKRILYDLNLGTAKKGKQASQGQIV